ncbi:hypothetical protein [Cryptosporangium phraense]|uniref:Uncharacterized protein n=1 Tax=Cryptosporangium phraense TaxID=2593070 RepID=A0A545AR36_9ACTN|nr:hypothetical protein [Cryptosporangium phraense]TQS43165.1 hypothetical protein FL583_20160 [Cryptosporangium phraense]
MGRWAVIVGGVAGLVVCAVGLPLAAAPRATTGTTTDGAAADCVAEAVAAYRVRIVCGITDLARDGDSVYVGWRTTSGRVRSIYDREGAGQTISVTGYAPTARVGPPHRVLWKVCRDRQAPLPDACSEWRTVWAEPAA